MDAFVQAKIVKYLVEPVAARWGAFGSDAEKAAYVEDAVIDLGRMDGEVITQALHRVRQGWKYPRRPAVADFAAVAKAIWSEQPKARRDGETPAARANRVNQEAHTYAAAFMWDTQEGRQAFAEGYALPMREWVRREAARQGYAGGPVSVRIPAAQVVEWRDKAEEAKRLRDAPPVRTSLRSLGQLAKQSQAKEAAE
jgi:hypothetical protein